MVALTACGLGSACSSSKSDDAPANLETTAAAAVAGAVDSHCAGKPAVTVSQASCTAPADDDDDADGGAPMSDYGDTMNNAEGDDDDCKYHVKWQSTAVTENSDVTFVVTAVHKVDGSPVAGAKPDAEVFLDETHPAPNSDQKTVETSPGVYQIGPVKFDVAGKWTARFHFFDTCNDHEDSPHGHAAFFVQVP
jgi:hypothetical protein